MIKLKKIAEWIDCNITKILFLIGVNVSLILLSRLPYINLIGSQISFIPYVVNILLVITLFNPDKKHFLYFGLGLFILAIPFEIIGMSTVLNYFGNLSYFLIATYLVYSIYILKRNTK